MPTIDTVRAHPPMSVAGIRPFDAADYTTYLTTDSAYECTVKITDMLDMSFSNATNYLAVGAIERIYASEFVQSGEMRHALPVRAASADSQPLFGKLIPLTLDTYLWAWRFHGGA